MPDTIDTDEDAQNVRLQIDDILLDSRISINDTVTADAAIQKLLVSGEVYPDASRNKCRISASHKTVIVTAAMYVRDGIALKKNPFHKLSAFR